MITNIFGVNVYVDMVREKSKIDETLSKIDLKSLTRPSDHWNCDCFTGHSQELVKEGEQWVQVFLSCILPNMQQYINSLIGDQKIDYEMEMQSPWINLYEKGNYQEMHSHVGLGEPNRSEDQRITISGNIKRVK
jgi:hypothetical protein